MSGRKQKREKSTPDTPALLRMIRSERGLVVAFGRTKLGQAAYDVLMSSMSAAEAARRHKLDRGFVLRMRRENPELRKRK